MMEILFIRHAETDMAETFCGHTNPDLNAHGRAQLPVLVKKLQRLRGESISAVYTSDLLRAHSTAATIADAFGVKCISRHNLREMNFGRWEGLRWKEIEERDPDFAARWIAQYPELPAPGGETIRHFKKRVLSEIHALSRIARGSRIAVVTHAGVLRTVLSTLQGYSDETAWRRTRTYGCIVRHKVRPFSVSLRVPPSSFHESQTNVREDRCA